jgi:hypothetical protein
MPKTHLLMLSALLLSACQSQPTDQIVEPLNYQPIRLAWYQGLDWLQQRDPRVILVEPSPLATHLKPSLNSQDPIGLSGLLAAAATTQGYVYNAAQVLPVVKKYRQDQGKTSLAHIKQMLTALKVPAQAYQMYDPVMLAEQPALGISITPSAYRTFHVIRIHAGQYVDAFFADGKTYRMPIEVFAHTYRNQPIVLIPAKSP